MYCPDSTETRFAMVRYVMSKYEKFHEDRCWMRRERVQCLAWSKHDCLLSIWVLKLNHTCTKKRHSSSLTLLCWSGIKEHWCEVEYLSSAYWTLLQLIALHPRLAKWRLEIVPVMGWDGGHGQRRQMDYPNGINSHLLRPIVEEVPIDGLPKPGSVLGLGWVS